MAMRVFPLREPGCPLPGRKQGLKFRGQSVRSGWQLGHSSGRSHSSYVIGNDLATRQEWLSAKAPVLFSPPQKLASQPCPAELGSHFTGRAL